jgi:hypothetical protein
MRPVNATGGNAAESAAPRARPANFGKTSPKPRRIAEIRPRHCINRRAAGSIRLQIGDLSAI